jgi:hypothetical protein
MLESGAGMTPFRSATATGLSLILRDPPGQMVELNARTAA